MPTMMADLTVGRNRLRMAGEDRVAFLHGQCTNDIRSLKPGQDCYAAFLNAKGKMRGDAYIVCLDDAFLLDASAELRESLEKFIITEDVNVEDVSATIGEWLVVDAVGKAARPAVAPYPELEVVLPADAVIFAHPLGIGILSPTPLPVTLDANALEVLRIEAGVPKWGVDMDEDTIPVEAGLESRAISYDKGCYIGQETIARIKTYGHVNRRLVQLEMDGDWLPGRGERIFCGVREAGCVTSAASSNRLGKTLALGYVRREFAMAGVKLTIGKQAAEVLKLCGQ
jgi:folate-binding protein YgfZ